MKVLDCFIIGLDEKQIEKIYTENRDRFIFCPFPIWVDNGTEEKPEPVLLGYHLKVTPEFYKLYKPTLKDSIRLYHEVGPEFKREGKYPMHVFGPGEGIDDVLDENDYNTICRFQIMQDYALTRDVKKALKIEAGALVDLTAQELAEKMLEVSADGKIITKEPEPVPDLKPVDFEIVEKTR